jgi:GDPmannose 4,6-dehydratase
VVKKRALITGIFGQDGSYLAEYLYREGYEIHGIEKYPLTDNARLICAHLKKKGVSSLSLHDCDLNSYAEVRELMNRIQPDECYHLAASHYSSEVSDDERMLVDRELFHNNVLSSLNLISAISEISRHTRFLLAGSCLMFEESDQSPQHEYTPYAAGSMYGLSKITASKVLNYFRETHGLHLSVAILYNHESPRRQEAFISKKVVSNLVKVKRNVMSDFYVGDLSAIRDWGYAKDYVYGMWLMCQQDKPQDYILAAGDGHTVEEFLVYAAQLLELDPKSCVKTKEELIRKPLKTTLIGDPALAKSELKWSPAVSFKELIEIMVMNEIEGELD